MGEGALHAKYADSGPVSLSSSALGLLAIQESGAGPLSVGSGAEASMAQKVSGKWAPEDPQGGSAPVHPAGNEGHLHPISSGEGAPHATLAGVTGAGTPR